MNKKNKSIITVLTLSAIILVGLSIVLVNMSVIKKSFAVFDVVNNQKTAIELTKVILENRLKQELNYEKFSASLNKNDEKDILDDYWEISYQEQGKIIKLKMLKMNAEISDIVISWDKRGQQTWDE